VKRLIAGTNYPLAILRNNAAISSREETRDGERYEPAPSRLSSVAEVFGKNNIAPRQWHRQPRPYIKKPAIGPDMYMHTDAYMLYSFLRILLAETDI
jgi:hypothetical protein